MLKTILAISGKPGLYKLVSHGNRMLIVESLNAEKKRIPAYERDQVISLGDIAMYTDNEEVALSGILQAIAEKEEGKKASVDPKKDSKETLFDYFEEVLPNYDRDRVQFSDVKKLIGWYNILIENGITEFKSTKDEQEEKA